MNSEAGEGPRRSTSTIQGVPEPWLDPTKSGMVPIDNGGGRPGNPAVLDSFKFPDGRESECYGTS